MLLAEREIDVEPAVADRHWHGFHQRLGRPAGFFEDVEVFDLLILDLDGENALAGLGDLPIRVLATWNRRPLSAPVTVPDNTRLVEWVSYSQTMGRCALVVCHAGHGTMVRALASGSPVLAVPHSGDMAENAARADWAGVGVRLPWRLLSPVSVRLAARRALESATIAERAGRLAEWAAGHDGAERAADLVEQLALSRAGGS
jgi:UDP:flavonoid glycosyltransferase YjiC (YdhE family)